jgi:predicted  nucleic acid-binding Zn-ribbon protein
LSRTRDKKGWNRLQKKINELKSEKNNVINIDQIRGLRYELESLKKNQEVLDESRTELLEKLEEVERSLNVGTSFH